MCRCQVNLVLILDYLNLTEQPIGLAIILGPGDNYNPIGSIKQSHSFKLAPFLWHNYSIFIATLVHFASKFLRFLLVVLLLWPRVGLPCHSFLAPGCGGCALTFAGINLLVYLDFPSLICLNEINGHSCGQIYPKLELSLLGIPANRAHPKQDKPTVISDSIILSKGTWSINDFSCLPGFSISPQREQKTN